MPDEKSEKISISLPPSLLAVIDDHETNRSSYIQRLVTADLAAAGKLPGSQEAKALAEARDLIAAIGPDQFIKTLKEAARAA